MANKHIRIDIETWTFEIEKVEYLLLLCDGEASGDNVWALTSAATALCEKLRGSMIAKLDELASELPAFRAAA